MVHALTVASPARICDEPIAVNAEFKDRGYSPPTPKNTVLAANLCYA
jgi:hypothetical protein